jgi:hypothetical protein
MGDFAKGAAAILVAMVALMFVVGGCFIAGCIGKTANVLEKQVGLEASLKKYEEFKDIAARLDAKKATIEATEVRLAKFEQGMAVVPRHKWSRTQEAEYALLNQELLGMKASYNGLAADYNSRMAKVNYSFANVGELPKGADRPLPREYRSYENK